MHSALEYETMLLFQKRTTMLRYPDNDQVSGQRQRARKRAVGPSRGPVTNALLLCLHSEAKLLTTLQQPYNAIVSLYRMGIVESLGEYKYPTLPSLPTLDTEIRHLCHFCQTSTCKHKHPPNPTKSIFRNFLQTPEKHSRQNVSRDCEVLVR